MVGGFVAAAVVKGGVHVVRLPLDVSLAFVVIVPDVQLSTSRARQALPSEVSRESASFNLSRMALLMAGMADCRLLIPEAAEDRLHQDYRSPLFPAAPKLLAALVAGGALASCWSGAGPSLLGMCRGVDAPKVQTAGEQALADAGLSGQVLLLHADMDGLLIDRDGSAGLYDDTL
jgi:homoserine kinase